MSSSRKARPYWFEKVGGLALIDLVAMVSADECLTPVVSDNTSLEFEMGHAPERESVDCGQREFANTSSMGLFAMRLD